jgi:Undecaprenyl-phosphate galactose phosphotransferase WbaP
LSSISIRESHTIFTWTIGVAVILGIVSVPVGRELVRLSCARAPWWGYPTVILGDVESASSLIRTLQGRPDLALKPLAALCPDADAKQVSGVPVIEEGEIDNWEPMLRGRGYAVLVGALDTREALLRTVALNRKCFPHVLVIPQKWEFSCLWVTPKDLGGLLGLEIREHLFHPGKQALKRVMDLLLSLAFLVVLFPLFVAVALMIRFTSPGPVFYGQKRIGRAGREFRAWKFRSMVVNADELLEAYLGQNPKLAAEWNATRKLQNDPRTTKIGNFLRRTSLDELPQLWNVLCGEMSLVGPRPIVREEIARYGRYYYLYSSVRSGLTGLWQVSGRSETSYDERVTFDTFYVRNWSVWLDLYILIRTIGTVCTRAGAY